MKKYYLAYGSNLNLSQMKFRCKNAIPVGKIVLKDYRLVYKGGQDNYAYLTIEPNEGSIVPLGVYQISFLDEIFLDRYEGYPDFYHKDYVPITIDGKEKKALIYIMNSNFKYHLPSKQYVDTCMQGYDDFGFDKKLLEEAFEYSEINKSKRFRK